MSIQAEKKKAYEFSMSNGMSSQPAPAEFVPLPSAKEMNFNSGFVNGVDISSIPPPPPKRRVG